MTILVIDDDVESVRAMSYYLEKLGFKVVVAHDGYAATAAAVSASPDLIISDFQMPAGDGAAVYERLRSAQQTWSTPVIFLSGIGVEALKAAIPPAPNIRYLGKPVEYSDVRRCLRELLPDFVDPKAASDEPAKDEPLNIDD